MTRAGRRRAAAVSLQTTGHRRSAVDPRDVIGCCSTSCPCRASARSGSMRSAAGLGGRPRRHWRGAFLPATGPWMGRSSSIRKEFFPPGPPASTCCSARWSGSPTRAACLQRPARHRHRRRRRDDAARLRCCTGVCPIIKNIWTSTFALFSGGFCVALLGLLMPVTQVPGVRQALWPARIFGENPLLAYIIVFLIAPLIDYNWFGDATAPLSLRGFGQAWFEHFVEPRAASLLFGLVRAGVHLRDSRDLPSQALDPQALSHMELIDIGVNLAHDSFDADRDAVMQRAARGGRRADGRHRLERRKHAQGDRALARASPACCSPPPASIRTMPRISPPTPCPPCRRWRATPDVVAVGECGLDYFRDFSPRDLQRRAFGWQLELAAATGKPVFLHQRDAHDDFIAILREHRRDARRRALLHGRGERTRCLSRARPAHRHHRLDQRRAARPAPARGGEGNSRRPAADRNRRALSTAARHQARAEDPAQRARLPAVRGARDCRRAW